MKSGIVAVMALAISLFAVLGGVALAEHEGLPVLEARIDAVEASLDAAEVLLAAAVTLNGTQATAIAALEAIEVNQAVFNVQTNAAIAFVEGDVDLLKLHVSQASAIHADVAFASEVAFVEIRVTALELLHP